MELDALTWYAIAIGSVIICSASLHLSREFPFHFDVVRGFWQLARPVTDGSKLIWLTTARVLFIIVCIAVNVLVIMLPLSSLPIVSRRCAVAASLNFVPALLTGRMSFLLEWCGITLSTSWFLHISFATISISQAIVHSILSSLSFKGWMVLTVNGAITGFLLLLAAFTSVGFLYFKDRKYKIYYWAHVGAALGAAFVLSWHVLSQHGQSYRIAPTLACGLWISSTIFRLANMHKLGWNLALMQSAGQGNPHLCYFTPHRSIKPFPGCYFYVYFHQLPILERFYGLPMQVYYWDDENIRLGQETGTRLAFLVESERLLKNIARVSLDGPYGKNIAAELFETIVLAAEGSGIAGVMSYIYKLAESKHLRDQCRPTRRPRDLTRRVTLLWKLMTNEDEMWAVNEFSKVMNLDPKLQFLEVEIYYPRNASTTLQIPDEFAKHWKQDKYDPGAKRTFDVHCERKMRHIIEFEASKPGRCAVIACGGHGFVKTLQKIVGQLENPTTFVRAEFDANTRNQTQTQMHKPLAQQSRHTSLNPQEYNRTRRRKLQAIGTGDIELVKTVQMRM